MKPAPFEYCRPATPEEALGLLAQFGEDARVLAGGQSLIAMLNMRLARPSVLVDVMRIPGATEITADDEALTVPSAVRQADLLARPSLAAEAPLLAKAMPWIGHPQTRARGTVCGSLAHADPSAELPLALAALDGEVVLRSRRRRRTVKAADFFSGMMLTDLQPGEMIEAARVPLARPDAGYGFREVGRRRGDFAIVACAAVAAPDALRLAVGGVDDTPAIRDWPRLDGAALDDALNEFAWSLDAREDLHATARYRRDLVRRLGRQAIEEAIRCAN